MKNNLCAMKVYRYWRQQICFDEGDARIMVGSFVKARAIKEAQLRADQETMGDWLLHVRRLTAYMERGTFR